MLKSWHFEYLNELRTVAHRINDKESSLIAWESTQACESDESKQSVSFNQISESASKTRFELISSMSKSTSESASKISFVNAMIYLLTLLYQSANQSISCFCVN